MDYPVTMVGEAIAYVDGSYNDQTNEYGAGVAFFSDGKLTEFSEKGNNPEAATMRNVSGEVKAAMIAMREAYSRKLTRLVIYHDYQGIADWCTGAWKTKKEGTRIYKEYYQQMRLSGLDISFVKVEGHSGDVWNDHADMLARRAVGK